MAAARHAAGPQRQPWPSSHHSRSIWRPSCGRSHRLIAGPTQRRLLHRYSEQSLPVHDAILPCVCMLHPLAQLQAHWLCGLRTAVALSSGLIHLLLHTLHKISQPGRLIVPGQP